MAFKLGVYEDFEDPPWIYKCALGSRFAISKRCQHPGIEPEVAQMVHLHLALYGYGYGIQDT